MEVISLYLVSINQLEPIEILHVVCMHIYIYIFFFYIFFINNSHKKRNVYFVDAFGNTHMEEWTNG